MRGVDETMSWGTRSYTYDTLLCLLHDYFFHGFVPFPRCGSASGRQTLYHTILYVYDDSSIKLKTSFLAFLKKIVQVDTWQ